MYRSKKKKNNDLNSLFNATSLKDFLRSERLEWAGHVWSAEDGLIRHLLINKPNKKRLVGRPRQWWFDRVKDNLKKVRNEQVLKIQRIGKFRELW